MRHPTLPFHILLSVLCVTALVHTGPRTAAQDKATSPAINSTAPTKVVEGNKYEYKVEVTGMTQPKLTARGLPGWLTLDDDLLHGVPGHDDVGSSRTITLTAEDDQKHKARQRFKIEVAADPQYVKPPWTANSIKRYAKVGLKWSLKGRKLTFPEEDEDAKGNKKSHKKKKPTSEDWSNCSFEITKVTDTGVTVKINDDLGFTGKGQEVGETPGVNTRNFTKTYTWEEALQLSRYGFPGTSAYGLSFAGKSLDDKWSTKTYSGTIEVGDKRVKCLVYEFNYVDNHEGEDTSNMILVDDRETVRVYFDRRRPFVCLKWERVMLESGNTVSQELEKLPD